MVDNKYFETDVKPTSSRNTRELLKILCIIPPGNLEAEKCFPCIRRIQNWFHNDMFFRLVLFIFPIMFARVFLRNKHNRVKAFFGCIIFLLTLTKPNLLTKNDILKSTSEIFLMNPLMHAMFYTHLIFIMLSHSLHYQNLSTEIKTPSLNCYCYFRVISV